MAWTDRHCRYLHRLYAPDARLFTEMVTTGALLFGDQWHLLDFDAAEHPVVLQLGGNDPKDLAKCAIVAAERGYDEVNLNVGCPSDRVQRGTFGACLMLQPELVAECVATMQAAVDIPVTVKCRLGVDDVDNDEHLHDFIAQQADAGCQRIYLHARKAILSGLTPAQNRDIPPLQPDRVARVKDAFPKLDIVINGGITNTEQTTDYLTWADGVMIGRAAYHNPTLLTDANRIMFSATQTQDRTAVLLAYRQYMEVQLSKGVRLHSLTRHILTSCNGMPGARRFRQTLSDAKRLKSGDLTLFDEALSYVFPAAA